MILQSGLRVDQVLDGAQLSLRSPNIFQYARKAGYWTAFLDAQSAAHKFANYMRESDIATMDLLYRVSDHTENVPRYQYDRILQAQIRQILAKHEKVFLYILKKGTHFPYEGSYPPQERIFSPTMPIGSLSASTLAEIKGSYANAVRWSVDGFLKELLSLVDLQRSTIIYTSDHGQSIEQKGAGVGTHGKVVAPPRSQASVPMLVFGTAGETRLRSILSEIHDSTSHFQVFPSLLIMMGYPEYEVIKRYGKPLWKRGSGPRLFLSGDLFQRGRAFVNKFD